jgi:hypothetical protein
MLFTFKKEKIEIVKKGVKNAWIKKYQKRSCCCS